MSRRLAAALILVLCAAATALVLARRARPAFPVSDIAITELYTRDAAHARLAVGPYSRFGWHHPGPLLFYLLAPLYVAGGGNIAALHAAALALSLLAIGAAWYAAFVFSGPPLATAVLLAATLLIVRVPSLAASPWNPHAVVLPSIALVLFGAVAAAGRAEVLWIVALVASLIVQSDVAVVPVASVVMLVAMRRAPWHSVAIAAGVAAVVWMVPVLQQVTHTPGNLGALWRFFTSGGRAHVTLTTALAAWSDAMAAPFVPGFVLARGTILEPAVVWSHVTIAAAVVGAAAAGAIVADRRGAAAVSWFGTLSAGASLVALWSATRIEPPMSDHFTFWIAALGVADLAAVVALAPWTPAVEPIAVVAAAAIVAGLGVREVSRAADGTFAITSNAPSAPNFATSIRAYLAAQQVRRPLFRIDQEQWWLAAAILAELDREGVDYAVEPDWMPMFPDRFATNGTEDAELTLAAVGLNRGLAERPGNVTVDVSSFIHVEAVRRPRS